MKAATVQPSCHFGRPRPRGETDAALQLGEGKGISQHICTDERYGVSQRRLPRLRYPDTQSGARATRRPLLSRSALQLDELHCRLDREDIDVDDETKHHKRS